MGRSRSRSRSRDRDRGRDRSHSSSSSSSEDSAEREERMQRERDDREGGGAPRRSGGLGRYLALSGAIWRYLALSGYLILSHSISCRSDKRIGQTRPMAGAISMCGGLPARGIPRPRRVDGCTPRHLLCATVYSAGSQLPLEGTEMYQMAQMVKSRFCNASCATVKWH